MPEGPTPAVPSVTVPGEAAPSVDAVYAAVRAGLPGLLDDLDRILGPGWELHADPGERSHPRLRLRGPLGEDGRRLVALVLPVRCRSPLFHATVGVSVLPGDLDPAALDADAEPAWITRVRALGRGMEAGAAGPVRISAHPGGGSRGPAAVKLALADRFGLPRRYAKGWPEEFLGVRTEPVPGERFGEFARALAALLARLGPRQAAR